MPHKSGYAACTGVLREGISMKPTYEELTVQLANAESKCRELAAENVELKSDRDTLARYWIEDGGDEECAMSYCEQTPATDDFLDEVRAQGVDMFSDKFGGGTLLSDMVKETAKEFAAQLRKGAAL
ncbi:hypothetical protein [Citrobacter sp. Cy230]|uniref:hypothetical protein n=1 Tax=Citrobacter sp. Cy230 TaxID=2985163 RepID=UPI0025776F29|nr:hypothetical protein [Citrobacter sp. Cy230]MDM2723498.1 hypothetical protein [Citrobacter sp. Cy230]